ncbi:hypothetical protein ACMU_13260 [Actibacterium mucosum KCTC 23349]|uniref:VOC domain-containing protein n=1 Tax=Actibacterium mucosum KCTC 23349 TaxID=1454373 RepID=A0A037ZJ38_9RHOB|nr:VOC family protein [Actibacterium mucosum]KAJ55654.1 hypothetical protein ACMU_13260 [Actibacterium mucosum KCTC 23349]
MDLNQITIEVSDLDQSIEFYRKIGLHLIVRAKDRYARFEMPIGSTTFSLHHAAHPRVGGTVLYFEVADLAARHAELTGNGIVFDTPPTAQNWRWAEARFRDPDGHELCLFNAGPDRRFPPWRLQGG